MNSGTGRHSIAAFWHEIGRIGRLAFVGVLVSGVVAVSLGFFIPSAVRSHLIDARIDELERSMQMVWTAAPETFEPEADFSEFDRITRVQLLGGDTVRVKVWDTTGRIVWSDEGRLIGRSFPGLDDIDGAFDGAVIVEETDLTDVENEFERGFGRLIEFYLPMTGDSGDIEAVFEVYQRLDPFEQTLNAVRASTWLRIGTGLGVLGLFTTTLTLVTLRGAERRRVQSERLLHRSLDVREAERVRLANALHDDVGQPVYRLLYGLESMSEGHLEPARMQQEARRLVETVRLVDSTLRDQMRQLQASPVESDGLVAALEDLVLDNGATPRIAVTVDVDESALDPGVQEALYRAAREAVANAIRHSGAVSIDVRLVSVREGAELRVTDTGDWKPGDDGLGIATMRAMIDACGGTLSIGAGNDGGTVVTAVVPVGTSHR